MAMLWALGEEEEASDPLLLWLAMDELKVDRMEELNNSRHNLETQVSGPWRSVYARCDVVKVTL